MRDLGAQAVFIAARDQMPFEWGANDCVTFCAGALQALTGTDPLSGIPSWKDEKTALRALTKRGGLLEAVSGVLQRIPVALAHRGDVGAVQGERGPLLVIIEGLTLVGPDADGLKRLPRSLLIDAWSAGG